MELKRKREIKRLNSLPGFDGGFDWGTFMKGKPLYNPTPWVLRIPDERLDEVFSSATPLYQYEPNLNFTAELPDSTHNVSINNTQKVSASDIGNIATSAAAFGGSVYNAFGPTKGYNQLLADSGASYKMTPDFGFVRRNNIDEGAQLSELYKQNTNNTLNAMGTGAALGSSIGSIIPGFGTVLGGAIGAVGGAIAGIWGGESRRKRLQRKILAAQQLVDRTNTYNRSAGHSDYLQQNYNYRHNDGQNSLIYGAKHGKDCGVKLPGFVDGYGVYTSDGIKQGPANSKVAFGETIYNPTEGTANIVKTGKLDQDTNLSYLQPSDVVFGNHVDWNTGKTFRDEALPIAAVLEMLNKK